MSVLVLSGCSPQFDWRVVSVGDGVVTGVLPDRPRTETQQVAIGGHSIDLSMTMAEAGDVLFALGHAPLPDALLSDREAARTVAYELIASFYNNLNVVPPDPLPALGERFVIEGTGPAGPMHLEAVVGLGRSAVIEAVVMATQQAYAQAPVQDFWNELKMGLSD
ncbi:MAG: hypothetical protein L0H54_06290 [Alcaligenaceae bacterium]|nr:hypothetical protein [Alcaligenaceae bacterium]